MTIFFLLNLIFVPATIFAECFICQKFIKERSSRTLTFEELKNKFYIKTKSKLKYITLNYSNTNKEMQVMFEEMKNPMFTDKILIDKKNYLLTISKFVDYKINQSKQTFRAQANFILIEQIASLLAKNLIKTGSCKIFSYFKQLQLMFKLRQKELKVFKILLAKYLLIEIIKIETELNEISMVIQKSKTANTLKKYRKSILNSANIYGTIKFNKNSTRLISNFKNNKIDCIKNFLSELIEAEHRLKVSVTYITVLFS